MTERIRTVCSYLPKVQTLADVGCDHGYMAQYALQNGLCERVYIADISAESLKKAEALLQEEIKNGRCVSVCTDGLTDFPVLPDCVLIAGMGGEEIVKILTPLPEIPCKFVLQPMRNSPLVRSFLLERGAKIMNDFTFSDGKEYDLITGTSVGGDDYTAWELKFGRDNLRRPSKAFRTRLDRETSHIRAALAGAKIGREQLLERLYELEEITDALDDTL